MKRKSSGGFSLIETLIAIVILGMVVVPTCTALVMSIRVNDKTDRLLQAQLAVSSAVETLMAEGISGVVKDGDAYTYTDPFDDVNVVVLEEGTEEEVYYRISVSDDPKEGEGAPTITVITTVRAAKAEEGGGE